QVADPERYAEISNSCRTTLGRYRVLDDPAWQRGREIGQLTPEQRAWLSLELEELLLLWASVAARIEKAPAETLRYNELAEACGTGQPSAKVLRQRAALYDQLKRTTEADALRKASRATLPATARNLCFEAAEHMYQEQYAAALPLFVRASRLEPQD